MHTHLMKKDKINTANTTDSAMDKHQNVYIDFFK